MAYKIICYGDSNTYGACGFAGGRHHADIRWTDGRFRRINGN